MSGTSYPEAEFSSKDINLFCPGSVTGREPRAEDGVAVP